MASQFFIVHHHFKPGMAGSWWGVMAEADETAQAAMTEKWLNMVLIIVLCLYPRKVLCTVFGK